MAEIPTPHHLYVIEFTDSVVKVGRTCRLIERVKEHRKDAREIGAGLRSFWYESGFSDGVIVNAERMLIQMCKNRWPLVQGLEFFKAPFDEVVELAEDIAEANREIQRRRTAA